MLILVYTMRSRTAQKVEKVVSPSQRVAQTLVRIVMLCAELLSFSRCGRLFQELEGLCLNDDHDAARAVNDAVQHVQYTGRLSVSFCTCCASSHPQDTLDHRRHQVIGSNCKVEVVSSALKGGMLSARAVIWGSSMSNTMPLEPHVDG